MAQGDEYYLPAGNHLIDLADGRIVGPGDTVKLSADDLKEDHNKRYIDEGILLKLEKTKGGDST